MKLQVDPATRARARAPRAEVQCTARNVRARTFLTTVSLRRRCGRYIAQSQGAISCSEDCRVIENQLVAAVICAAKRSIANKVIGNRRGKCPTVGHRNIHISCCVHAKARGSVQFDVDQIPRKPARRIDAKHRPRS